MTISTPLGTGMGALPILDMPLPHKTDDFAADTLPFCFQGGHDAPGGGKDSYTQPTEDLGQLVLAGIDATTRLADPLELADDCLLYTSDAADDHICVDLGGRRIMKKKKKHTTPPYLILPTHLYLN